MSKPPDKAPEIAALNDLCRKAMGIAGRTYQTSGINALPLKDQFAKRPVNKGFAMLQMSSAKVEDLRFLFFVVGFPH